MRTTIERASPAHPRYLYVGNHGRARAWQAGLERSLAANGIEAAGYWVERRDFGTALPRNVGIVFVAGSGPNQALAVKMARAARVPAVTLTRQDAGEVFQALREHGLLAAATKPGSLHGYFDEAKASEPAPLTRPLLTLEERARLEERAATPEPPKVEPPPTPPERRYAVFLRGSQVWTRDMAHKGKGAPSGRPVVVDGALFRSTNEAAEVAGTTSGDVCACARRGVLLRGQHRVSYAGLDETLRELPGAFRDTSLDRNEPRKATSPKRAPVVRLAPPPSPAVAVEAPDDGRIEVEAAMPLADVASSFMAPPREPTRSALAAEMEAMIDDDTVPAEVRLRIARVLLKEGRKGS